MTPASTSFARKMLDRNSEGFDRTAGTSHDANAAGWCTRHRGAHRQRNLASRLDRRSYRASNTTQVAEPGRGELAQSCRTWRPVVPSRENDRLNPDVAQTELAPNGTQRQKNTVDDGTSRCRVMTAGAHCHGRARQQTPGAPKNDPAADSKIDRRPVTVRAERTSSVNRGSVPTENRDSPTGKEIVDRSWRWSAGAIRRRADVPHRPGNRA
jgi:hypothetical protein